MHQITSWLEEKRSAYLYFIVEKYESNPVRKQLFHELAEAAEKQALMWEKELKKTGQLVPKNYRPDARSRIIGFLLRFFKAQ